MSEENIFDINVNKDIIENANFTFGSDYEKMLNIIDENTFFHRTENICIIDSQLFEIFKNNVKFLSKKRLQTIPYLIKFNVEIRNINYEGKKTSYTIHLKNNLPYEIIEEIKNNLNFDTGRIVNVPKWINIVKIKESVVGKVLYKFSINTIFIMKK